MLPIILLIFITTSRMLNVDSEVMAEKLAVPQQSALIALDLQDYEMMPSELLSQTENQVGSSEAGRICETERIKRCISFKYGLSESNDNYDRDILKFARTSFLPQDTTAVPRECLESFSYRSHNRDTASEADAEDEITAAQDSQELIAWRKRDRRYSDTPANEASAHTLDNSQASEDESLDYIVDTLVNEEIIDGENARKDHTTSYLQSVWTSQGNKENIRRSQAETMKKYMDTSVNPCNDFYKYACGNWEHLHPIPRDKAGYDTFEMLRENLDIVLKELLESSDLGENNNLAAVANVDNNFDTELDANTNADFVEKSEQEKTDVDSLPGETHKMEEEQLTATAEEKAERLRKLIVSRRGALNRLLLRFKRQDTTEKRQHFAEMLAASLENNAHKSSQHQYQQQHITPEPASEEQPNAMPLNFNINMRPIHTQIKVKPPEKFVLRPFLVNSQDLGELMISSSRNQQQQQQTSMQPFLILTNQMSKQMAQNRQQQPQQQQQQQPHQQQQQQQQQKQHQQVQQVQQNVPNFKINNPNRNQNQNIEQTRRPIIQPAPAITNTPIRIPTPAHRRSAKQKAKDLYKSCINTAILKERGLNPLLKLIDSLGGWPVLHQNWNDQTFDWLDLTARLRRYNNDIFIVQWVGPDIKNSDENIVQFDQTSLGLPTREYFLQDINAKYLRAYQNFMYEVMRTLGAPNDVALKTAAQLIAFETQLAAITSPADQRLNVTKLYKRMTLRQLHNAVPNINWMRYLSILQERSVADNEQVVIYALDYMQNLVQLISDTDKRTVANYLHWRFIRHRINNVDERFEDSKQTFYHALFGREESPSRWKVCIAQVNTNMGMALGAMFVTRYFDENSKRDTMKMTHELQQAFRDILKSTDWLDSNTKQLAEIKVNAMSLKIGYPDFILNPAELNEKYDGIDIHPEKYFENTLNVLLHTTRMEQAKLKESVNKTNWQTAPAIVNAYYSRNKNQIMFPAGILQPPFYHRYFPKALNFGGIGVVIGHELTHGFDDKGRLFDANGNIHKWWTDGSIKGFDERARCIIAQYSNYTVGEVGISLNGESTQGENIADNGGIRQAFHAYKRWLRDNPMSVKDERLPGIGLSGEQLFFLNFGQVWCGAMRPEAVRNKLNTAIHSPGRFRVIGTLSNSFDFAREFNCPIGSPMNPSHKCLVW